MCVNQTARSMSAMGLCTLHAIDDTVKLIKTTFNIIVLILLEFGSLVCPDTKLRASSRIRVDLPSYCWYWREGSCMISVYLPANCE